MRRQRLSVRSSAGIQSPIVPISARPMIQPPSQGVWSYNSLRARNCNQRFVFVVDRSLTPDLLIGLVENGIGCVVALGKERLGLACKTGMRRVRTCLRLQITASSLSTWLTSSTRWRVVRMLLRIMSPNATTKATAKAIAAQPKLGVDWEGAAVGSTFRPCVGEEVSSSG